MNEDGMKKYISERYNIEISYYEKGAKRHKLYYNIFQWQ